MNVNNFIKETDSATIQAAIDWACETNENYVEIPSFNQRTGKYGWEIEQTILLPDNMTIVLDNAHLSMADGVMCQMFCNKLAWEDIGKNVVGEQCGINILGKGNAIIDGGHFTELNEFTSNKNGMPSVWNNLLIYFHNVKDFKISGIHVRNQRWWAIAFMFCERGEISNINFEISDCGRDTELWHHQDGIDLRVGCNNIIIENIMGEVGDDVIAMTALTRENGQESRYLVEGKNTDIHDISIRNVYGCTNMCAIIRILSHYHNRIYNINIENVHDISRPGKESRSQMVVRIGDEVRYYGDDMTQRATPGDVSNISIKGIYSRALVAIQTSLCIRNFHVSDVYVHTDGQYVWYCGHGHINNPIYMYLPEHEEKQRQYRYGDVDFQADVDLNQYPTVVENVCFENIFYSAKSENDEENGSLIVFSHAKISDVKINNIFSNSDLPLYRVRSCSSIERLEII